MLMSVFLVISTIAVFNARCRKFAQTGSGASSGTPDITAGMAAGAGSLAGAIHGGCFPRQSFRFLTLTTADMDINTVQDTGTDTD
jgi:hypothetical protein